MEIKKSPKADLENKKLVFFEIGLVISMLIVLGAFEWTTTDTVNIELANVQETKVEQEIIPITNQDEIKPPEPPKVAVVSDVIKVVEDNVDIDDDTDIFSEEFSEDASVEILSFDDEEVEEEEQQIFVTVEEMPSFGDGDLNDFRINWVQKNLKYPDIAAENGIQGKVYVSFVVEPDGRVSNVKVLKGVDPSIDKEAVRVVAASPRWNPGKQRGKPVRVMFNIPIVFVLQ